MQFHSAQCLWKFRHERHELACPHQSNLSIAWSLKRDIVRTLLSHQGETKSEAGMTDKQIMKHVCVLQTQENLEFTQFTLHKLAIAGHVNIHNLSKESTDFTFTFNTVNENKLRAKDEIIMKMLDQHPHLMKTLSDD